MPERKHYIEVHDLPDRIVALTDSELCTERREYVSAELHGSVCEAIEAWRTENEKLRNLCRDAIRLLNVFCGESDGSDCPAWTDKEHDCTLRDIEERAESLGITAS